MKDLYKWSKDTADRIWFGTGKETGSFTFHYLRAGRTIAPFTIYTNGKLALNYGYLLGPLAADTLEKFHGMIHEIPVMQHIPNVFANKWPSVEAEALKDPENLRKFKQAILWLGTQHVIPRT